MEKKKRWLTVLILLFLLGACTQVFKNMNKDEPKGKDKPTTEVSKKEDKEKEKPQKDKTEIEKDTNDVKDNEANNTSTNTTQADANKSPAAIVSENKPTEISRPSGNLVTKPNHKPQAKPSEKPQAKPEIIESEEEIVRTEKIPYEHETIEDPNLEKGNNIFVAGEEGLLEHRYLITYRNGKEVAREHISSNIRKKPVNSLTKIGTKPVIRTIQLKEKEPIIADSSMNQSFTINEALLDEAIEIAAKDGLAEVTYEAITIDGEIMDNETYPKKIIRKEILQEAIGSISIVPGTETSSDLEIKSNNEIIEEFDFDEKIVEREDKLIDYEKVATLGKKGYIEVKHHTLILPNSQKTIALNSIKQDKVEPIQQVKEIGVMHITEEKGRQETIDYGQEIVFKQLDKDADITAQIPKEPGKEGLKQFFDKVTYVRDTETKRENDIRSEVINEATDEIIYVYGLEKYDEENAKEFYTDEIIYQFDNSKPHTSESVVIEEAKPGLEVELFVEKYQYNEVEMNWEVQGTEALDSKKIIQEPKAKVIKVYTGEVEKDRQTSLVEEIPFKHETKLDMNQEYQGKYEIEVKGVPGRIVEDVVTFTYIENVDGKPVLKEKVTKENKRTEKEPITEIRIEGGFIYKEKSKEEIIPALEGIIEKEDPTLMLGETKLIPAKTGIKKHEYRYKESRKDQSQIGQDELINSKIIKEPTQAIKLIGTNSKEIDALFKPSSKLTGTTTKDEDNLNLITNTYNAAVEASNENKNVKIKANKIVQDKHMEKAANLLAAAMLENPSTDIRQLGTGKIVEEMQVFSKVYKTNTPKNVILKEFLLNIGSQIIPTKSLSKGNHALAVRQNNETKELIIILVTPKETHQENLYVNSYSVDEYLYKYILSNDSYNKKLGIKTEIKLPFTDETIYVPGIRVGNEATQEEVYSGIIKGVGLLNNNEVLDTKLDTPKFKSSNDTFAEHFAVGNVSSGIDLITDLKHFDNRSLDESVKAVTTIAGLSKAELLPYFTNEKVKIGQTNTNYTKDVGKLYPNAYRNKGLAGESLVVGGMSYAGQEQIYGIILVAHSPSIAYKNDSIAVSIAEAGAQTLFVAQGYHE